MGEVKSDLEIAQAAEMEHISKIAAKINAIRDSKKGNFFIYLIIYLEFLNTVCI